MSKIMSIDSDISKKLDKFGEMVTAYHDTTHKSKETLIELGNKTGELLEQIQRLRGEKEELEKRFQSQESSLRTLEHMFSEKSDPQNNEEKIFKEYTKRANAALRSQNLYQQSRNDKKFLSGMLNERSELSQAFVKKFTRSAHNVNLAMIEGSDPAGGYFILPQYSNWVIGRQFETTPMRQICNVTTTTSDVLNTIIDDQLFASGGWVGEVDPRAPTDTAQYGLLSIPAHEVYTYPRASLRMLEDANFNLLEFVTKRARISLDLLTNASFVSGNGIQKPRGIVDYPEWQGTPVVFGNASNYERGALETIYSGVANGFTYDGLVNIQNSLLEDYQANAKWLMTRQAWALILSLTDTNGRPLINFLNPLEVRQKPTLLGKEVWIAAPNTAPTNPTIPYTGGGLPLPVTGNKALVYGDFFIGYTIVDRGGVYTMTNFVTEPQYVQYYVRERVGGALTSYASLKVMVIGADPGNAIQRKNQLLENRADEAGYKKLTLSSTLTEGVDELVNKQTKKEYDNLDKELDKMKHTIQKKV
jgi:HK97 family phage major capsid protein